MMPVHDVIRKGCAGLLAPLVTALALSIAAVLPAGAQKVDFAKLLKETEVELEIPSDFEEIPVPQTEVFSFEKAWRKKDGSVEIRLALRPIRRMVIDYDDPHSSAPDPNDMYPLMFTAMIGQFARQGEMPVRDVPFELARKTFRADWASIAMFGADPALDTSHREGMLLALHKNRTADAYLLILYDDPDHSRQLLKELIKVVRFRELTPLDVLKKQEEEARKAKEAYLEEGGDQPQCDPPLDAKQVHRTEKDLDQSPEK